MSGANFEETQWSVVIRAQGEGAETARSALADLCNIYWFPVYSYIRRKGYAKEQTEDLTQGFFANFIERKAVSRADKERGKFRSFLLTSVNNFLTDEIRREHAAKRGGQSRPLSLDFHRADALYAEVSTKAGTPEELYERNWAETVLARAYRRLKAEYVEAGKAVHVETLGRFLYGKVKQTPYEEIAKELGMTAAAVRTAVYRLRKRYGDLIREEVARTLANDADTDTEIRHLLQILGR